MTTNVLLRPEKAGKAPRPSTGRGLTSRRLSAGSALRTGRPTAKPQAWSWSWQRRPKDADLAALCQHLGALYGSGITVAEALRTFAEETPSKPLCAAIEQIMADLESGRSLSEAFDRHPRKFSPYFRASIWAGEASGAMGETLERLARHLEKKQEMAQRIRNAFAYPVMLLVLLVCVVAFLVGYVVPVFAGVYERMGVDLPLATTILLRASGTLSAHPYLAVVPVALVLAVAVYMRRVRSVRLALDRWKVRLPLVGQLWKRITLYRFIRAFGEMMGAGVPVLECLNLAGKVAGNAAFDEALAAVRADVRRGMGLAEPLRRTGWLPPSLIQVIASGERSGRVAALLERASSMLEWQIDLIMKRTVSRLEPILTVLMAAAVGFILLAVYLPMFDVLRHIGR